MELKDILICHYFCVFRKDLNSYSDDKKVECTLFPHYGIMFLMYHFYCKLKKKKQKKKPLLWFLLTM